MGAVRDPANDVERKGREGRKEIRSCFASFATSAFNRDVLQGPHFGQASTKDRG